MAGLLLMQIQHLRNFVTMEQPCELAGKRGLAFESIRSAWDRWGQLRPGCGRMEVLGGCML